jgi:hypothetical protein
MQGFKMNDVIRLAVLNEQEQLKRNSLIKETHQIVNTHSMYYMTNVQVVLESASCAAALQ